LDFKGMTREVPAGALKTEIREVNKKNKKGRWWPSWE
jgi:hypothetical protein